MEKKCTKCKEVKWYDPQDLKATEFSPGSSWCKTCRATLAKMRARCLKEAGERAYDSTKVKFLDEERKMFEEEWEVFWPKVKDEKYLLLFDLMQSCGLRSNEALMFTPSDINFERGSAIVHTLKQKKRKGEADQIYIRPDIIIKLKEFPNKSEERYFNMTYVAAYNAFKKALKQTSLNQRLGLHSLRHLCGNRLGAIPGVNDIIASKILRHATYDNISREYMSVNPRRLKQIYEEMWKGQTRIWENRGQIRIK